MKKEPSDSSLQDSPLNDIQIGFVTSEWAKAQSIKTHYQKKTDSTNTWAKKESFSEDSFNENLILFLSDEQTAGRGRGENTWSNARIGSQLFSTWSFLVEEFPKPSLTARIGLALCKACKSTWPFLNFSLKSPNDLFLDDKKVAGILVETLSQGDDLRVLVGLGLNVFSHPKEVVHSTSLLDGLFNQLPKKLPFLAEDWMTFLERFLYELSLAIQMSFENLDTTTEYSLLHFLNLNPHLKEKFTTLNENGEPSGVNLHS